MKKRYYILFVFAFLFYACYDDQGNYDYGDINEVLIDSLPKGVVTKLRSSDTLKVKPFIHGSLAGKGESDYEYTWTAVLKDGKGEETKAIEIGKEKNLDYFVELSLGKYQIYLNVFDKTSGVTWRRGFELNVSIATSTGWLVLCDRGGETRLDMISYVDEREPILRDLLKEYNIPHKKGPERILFTLNYAGIGKIMDRIILVTKTGTSFLEPEYLSWEEAFDFKYEMGMVPEKFEPTYVAAIAPRDHNWSRNILLTSTEVYCRRASPSYFYELPRNYVDGKTFKAAPFVITSAEDYNAQWEPPVLLYDTDNKQFVQLDMAWNGTGCRVPTIKNPAFDMRTGKEFVYAANTRQSDASSFVVLCDSGGALWLHGFGSIYKNAFEQLANYHYRLDAPDIERAKLFAVHTYFYYLFYIVDNQIYQFDMVDKTSRKITPVDETGKEVDMGGEEITFIKFNPLQYGTYTNNSDSYKQIEYRLIVGSDKGGENGGMIRMFNIQERMENDVTLYKEYSGFARPVDIVFRERK